MPGTADPEHEPGRGAHVAQRVPERAASGLRELLLERFDALLPRHVPLALVDFPDALNCGDMLIWGGERALLAALGREVRHTCSVQSYAESALRAALGTDGVILMHGGGNFGDRYTLYHAFRERLLRTFPEHAVLMFPQSVHFADPRNLERSRALFNAHGRVTLCARDTASQAVLERHFTGCRIELLPDMAFCLDNLHPPALPTRDIVWISRTDSESRFAAGRPLREGSRGLAPVAVKLAAPELPDGAVNCRAWEGGGLSITDWYELDVGSAANRHAYVALPFDAKARLQLDWAATLLARGRVLVSDRLHAHILATRLGMPQVLLDNDYGKLRNFWRDWTAGRSDVTWAETPEEAYRAARELLAGERCAAARAARQLADEVKRRGLSYLTAARLHDLADAALELERSGVEGLFVEAGCGLGGSAIVLAGCKGSGRELRLYDVFAQIPPPSDKDGEDVHRRYAEIAAGRATGIDDGTYYGYLPDLKQRIARQLEAFGHAPATARIALVEGLFEETMAFDGPIALAHVDADWYASVTTCLERIVPRLAPGGIVIVDDFQDWTGCRRAVQDYFAGRRAAFYFSIGQGGALTIRRRCG